MKRFSAIFLFSIVLFSQTEIHQLLKLPVLVQHFLEHKTGSERLSLSQFMALHYFGNHQPDADHDMDMQLPFKANNCLIASVAVVIPEPVIFPPIPALAETKSFPKIKDDRHLSDHVKNIFRPPQLS